MDALRAARRILLTTHVKPDGDALGSVAAMQRWLAGRGKAVEVLLPTAPHPKYAFLDPEGTMRAAWHDVHPGQLDPPDLIAILDTGTWPQLEPVAPLLRDAEATILVVDHHRTQDALADLYVVDPDAASTGLLVHRLIATDGAPLDAETATYLFAALAADTDWYRFPRVNGQTLRTAAELADAGANPNAIYQHLFLNESLEKVRLLGRAIDSMACVLGGRAITMRLTLEDFRRTGADPSATENIINECLKVRGVDVGVLLVEADRDQTRVSLRSKPGVDILAVAERFGGGGHTHAAGMRLDEPLESAAGRVVGAIEAVLAPRSAERG